MGIFIPIDNGSPAQNRASFHCGSNCKKNMNRSKNRFFQNIICHQDAERPQGFYSLKSVVTFPIKGIGACKMLICLPLVQNSHAQWDCRSYPAYSCIWLWIHSWKVCIFRQRLIICSNVFSNIGKIGCLDGIQNTESLKSYHRRPVPQGPASDNPSYPVPDWFPQESRNYSWPDGTSPWPSKKHIVKIIQICELPRSCLALRLVSPWGLKSGFS